MENNSITFLNNSAKECNLCPRNCKIDRFGKKTGICGVNTLRYCAANLHYGEEPTISGNNGSGTVFFSGCSLKCLFCQNYPNSQYCYGKDISINELSKIFLKLQKKNAHNINLVTPTHLSFLIIPAIINAKKLGLNIPIVYNTSGYENLFILKKIIKYINIFLYDMKYSDNRLAAKYSGVVDYVENNRRSFEFILKSKKNRFNKDGIMQEGIIVRHLVLPNYIGNTLEVLKYLSPFKEQIYISLMFQYFPTYKAENYPKINRKITRAERSKVLKYFNALKFPQGWVQEL